MSAEDLFASDVVDPLDVIERAGSAGVTEDMWPPLLSGMLRVLEAVNRRKGMDEKAAFDHARDDVVALSEYFGARMVYLPKGERLRLALRDAEIWRSFTGRNARDLAEKYQLSEPHLYQVLAQQRSLNLKRFQGRLFE
jgi:Mor family transcriptional regulator